MVGKAQTQEFKRETEETEMDLVLISAAASVAMSWYFFFARGDREEGLFVGLWPPTILAFASYFRQTRMQDMMTRRSSGVVRQVQRKLQK